MNRVWLLFFFSLNLFLADEYITFTIRPFRKIPNYSLFVPPNFASALFLFSLGTIVSPKRNWKQCLHQIWGDKQRVFWYFPKWPIIEKNTLNYLDFCQNIDFNHVSFSIVVFFLQNTVPVCDQMSQFKPVFNRCTVYCSDKRLA